MDRRVQPIIAIYTWGWRLERKAWIERFNHYSNIHMGLETRAESMDIEDFDYLSKLH